MRTMWILLLVLTISLGCSKNRRENPDNTKPNLEPARNPTPEFEQGNKWYWKGVLLVRDPKVQLNHKIDFTGFVLRGKHSYIDPKYWSKGNGVYEYVTAVKPCMRESSLGEFYKKYKDLFAFKNMEVTADAILKSFFGYLKTLHRLLIYDFDEKWEALTGEDLFKKYPKVYETK